VRRKAELRREAKAEPSTKQKTAEVQANPTADLEGGGVILRIRRIQANLSRKKKTKRR
jgi:hypothetical protein